MLLLSYDISPETPMYGHDGFPVFETVKDMTCGDSCNALRVSFNNHTGTHLDCPRHFSAKGIRLTDYPPESWKFDSVATLILTDVPREGRILTPEDLAEVAQTVDHQAEAVVLKTGFGARRGDKAYWETPPGFSPEVADWLRASFPRVRLFGFDLISLSSFTRRDIGREAHLRFLDHERAILILEDMKLDSLRDAAMLRSMLVSPLFLKDADGAPCSVWGNL